MGEAKRKSEREMTLGRSFKCRQSFKKGSTIKRKAEGEKKEDILGLVCANS